MGHAAEDTAAKLGCDAGDGACSGATVRPHPRPTCSAWSQVSGSPRNPGGRVARARRKEKPSVA